MNRLTPFLVLVALLSSACMDKSNPPPPPSPLTQLRTDRTYLRDAQGRYVFFNGVNVSCSTKVGPPGKNARGEESYVGRPFPLEKARENFERLRSMGFDSIRLLVLWEAIEPLQRGVYDEEYLDYVRELVKLAGEYGLYVLVDFHQDMFSRHLFVKFNRTPSMGAPGS
ncbi:MAG: cellulase family glycosylhydrolase, partial [Myxococcaceae bacterium]